MDDGGPAFPIVDRMVEMSSPGMSLRDYFAAHAPDSVQWDFVVRGFEKRPEVQRAESGPSGEIVVLNEREVSKWDVDRDNERMRQWPYVWADAMLAERRKGK